MSHAPAGKFQDHYKVLGVEPKADGETLERAHRQLAAKFHPETGETPDEEKYKAIVLAMEVLTDPEARKTFDAIRFGSEEEGVHKFSGAGFFESLTAETQRRTALLCVLYDRRLQKPTRPGIPVRSVEKLIQGNSEQVRFAMWYLKQKGLAGSDDKSNMEITIQGIDYLEQNQPHPDAILPMLRPQESAEAPRRDEAAVEAAAPVTEQEPTSPQDSKPAEPTSPEVAQADALKALISSLSQSESMPEARPRRAPITIPPRRSAR